MDSQLYLNKLGENIKKARKANALSLRQMSALCNIDHSDIAKMEKGRVNITVLTLVELAMALEVQPGELVCFDTKNYL